MPHVFVYTLRSLADPRLVSQTLGTSQRYLYTTKKGSSNEEPFFIELTAG